MPDLDGSSSLWLFFLAGLSVGGLSCIAVQGGLLVAAVAQQAVGRQGDRQGDRQEDRPPALVLALPAVQFLTAKTVAYVALGAVLGWVGQVFSPRFQGFVLVAVGVLMALLVLQMFDVHPALRRLAPRPPKAVQRFIGQRARAGGAWSPAVLGGLTVLIPCSVTLAVELLAARTQSPVRGALVLGAFTLGTAPLFLALALGGAWLGRASHRVFKPLAAVVVLAIAFLSVQSGLRLLGWRGTLAGSGGARIDVAGTAVPLAVPETSGDTAAVGTTVVDKPAGEAPAVDTAAAASAPSAAHQEARIDVTTTYQPQRLQVRAGIPTSLKLVSNGAKGCIRAFTVPAYNILAMLPETGETVVELPAAEPGEIAFSCSMGMYYGSIEVTP